MRRLFVMLPDAETCQNLVDELEETGIPEHHLHVISSLAQHIENMPAANVWQKTELADGLLWGVGMGGAAGLLGGLLLTWFPPPGLELGLGSVALMAALGSFAGGVVFAALGSHEHNHDFDQYSKLIEQGQLLLMVDVPRGQVDDVRRLMTSHHPEAKVTFARQSAA